MKQIKLLLFALIVLIAFSSSASALTLNFNDGTVNCCTVINPSAWSVPSNSSWDLTQAAYVQSGGVDSRLWVLSSPNNYLQFDVNFKTFSGVTSDAYVTIGSNATTTFGTSVSKGLAIGLHTDTGSYYNVALMGEATSYVPWAIMPWVNTWIRFKVLKTGSTINITVSYPNNGTIINTQNVVIAYDISTSDRIQIGVGGAAQSVYFDNIIASSVSPSISTSISWASNDTIVKSNTPVSWSISDTDWNTWSCGPWSKFPCSWSVYDTISPVPESNILFAIDIGTQTGSYNPYNDFAGVYTANLQKCAFYICSIVSTDTMTVRAESTSYMNIPSIALIKQNVTATYHIGKANIIGSLEWYFIDNGVEVRENREAIMDTDGSINISFSRVGVYNVYLKDGSVNGQIFAVRTIKTSFDIGGTPTNNFSTSSIKLIAKNGTGGSGGQYYLTDLIDGNYSIKGSVFSRQGVFYVDVYNIDIGAETLKYFGNGMTTVGVTDAGLFGLVINNKPDVGVSGYWQPGNNSIRLMVQYPNGTSSILATDNFSLSSINQAGYGLYVSPLNVIVGGTVLVTATTPNIGAYIIVQANGLASGGYSERFNLSVGTKTLTMTFNEAGVYGILLFDLSNNIQMGQQVTVSGAVTPTGTPTPTSTPNSQAASTMSNNLLGFMVMPAFWGVILWILCIYSVSGKGGKTIELTGIILAILEAIVGLWAPYTPFVVVIIVVLMGVKWKYGKEVSLGSE